MNVDRRRINGPSGGTAPPVYTSQITQFPSDSSTPPKATRTRAPNALRKMFLKTGVTPSASGSAYLELSPSNPNPKSNTTPKPTTTTASSPSSLKLTCTVHGPRPLPKSAPFSPLLTLSTHIKYAPFATRARRGYLRDASERDLSVHLETALRGVIIGDRWPKSGVEVIITVLEGEDEGDSSASASASGAGEWALMSVLAGCITVASAAIADAGIDCVDAVAGGVAALVPSNEDDDDDQTLLLDPVPSEHATDGITAAAVVAYLPSRDEITDLWLKGDMSSSSAHESLVDGSVAAARGSHRVLVAALKESASVKMDRL